MQAQNQSPSVLMQPLVQGPSLVDRMAPEQPNLGLLMDSEVRGPLIVFFLNLMRDLTLDSWCSQHSSQ